MQRDYKVFLEDILEAIERILRYTNGDFGVDFLADQRTLDAVIRNFLVIGEAAKSVPARIRHKYPEVEWRKLTGFRDVLIHEYFGIKPSVIGDVIKTKLPALKNHIQEILAKEADQ